MSTESCSKVAQTYCCQVCDYSTSKTSSYKKHLTAAKHILLTDLNKKLPKVAHDLVCSKCDKSFKSRAGLWGHSKKCTKNQPLSNDLVCEIIKQNHEFKEIGRAHV